MNDCSRPALVAGLRAHGIAYLDDGELVAVPPASPAELVMGLAASRDPRLHNALAVLFVRQPQLASLVPDLVSTMPPDSADRLRRQYTAAVYLQHMWRTRLRLSLDEAGALPDLFSAELGLPAPEERFGLAGLRALEAQTGFTLTASYEAQMAQLFDQLRRERSHEPAPTG
jgi:hypothetical protein